MRSPRHQFALAGAFLWLAVSSPAQPVINTLAGYSGQGYTDGTANRARFFQPLGAAMDAAGNILVADTFNHTIRKVAPGGSVTTIAGLAGVSGSTDGAAGDARFNQPQGVAVDSSGNVYVGDTGNNTIRKITPGGIVSTLAGLPGVAGSSNGIAGAALFFQPAGLAADASGNIYVADYGNSTIRKITPSGAVSTLAGSAGNVGTNNGAGGNAQFNLPQGVAVDGSGNVYVADTANHAIRTISSGGVVSTMAGSPGSFGSGVGANARFYQPTGIAVDTNGNVFVADTLNHTIRQIAPGGAVSTIAGLAGAFGSVDGTNSNARFWNPSAVAVGAGGLVVVDTGNGTLRKVISSGPDWITTTLAGSPSSGNADGAGTDSRFFWPAGIAADGSNNLYVADTQNAAIRKVSPSGAVTTLAGLAGVFGSADGTGAAAQFLAPQGIATDSGGSVYIADTGNNTIRKITLTGDVSTLAGTPGMPGIADGTGSGAAFNQPQGIAVDSGGTIYIADTGSHTIRKMTSGGAVTTLAGLAGNPGSMDGTNSAARFNSPAGLATDSGGNIYVCDCFNHTIRLITPAGLVTTLAGLNGVWGNADDTNSAARFCRPLAVAIDGAGNLYVADSGNECIREIRPLGTNWVVTTVAGVPNASGSLDRPAASAQFNCPAGIAVDSGGFIYVADAGNNAIRVNKLLPPTLQVARLQAKAVLSWPLASPGFTVESTGPLPPTWSAVTNSVAVYGQNYVLTNDLASPAAFYRLHKP